ncbi:hypothetical protein DES53_104317 [Roseimicrobium gellanilyticum]|uniref:Glycosyl hydrolase-like 10 domain-containing protein n=1 Tax=Roseimicrobium gellanilyticum TaxID=748857 RepID=A0A366HNY5_9BACT|nr:hypothetical protein [Roseimicrobium gellanilyticum]RBP44496.1 hypothetical protein DES53_104317 [Roseimicrobium gellanilyticum]
MPPLSRRHFLTRTASATTAAALAGHHAFSLTPATAANVASGPGRKAPFKVLYSNDATNITSCIAPWRTKGAPLRKEMIEATVDEVAGTGVDAHFLQPGLGMVPMWPSKVIPLKEHYEWIQQRYGTGPDSFGNFVLRGGDVVQVFLDRCKARGQAGFISVRLNDAHHKERAGFEPKDKPGASIGMSVTRHYVAHPEYWLREKSEKGRGYDLVQNWAEREVRVHKFKLIEELCENYDLDGIELDFMRFYNFFRPEETKQAQRRDIMTSFVSDVRALLDRTERNGKRRWLCARVPAILKAHDPLGIHLPSMVAAGLDMVNLSVSYFTVQQTDLAAIRASIPDASVYHELCHSIWNGTKLTPGYDTFSFRRTTKEQYHTTAHLAYARGADGVSAFNFAYYREHGGPGRGPFSEPPFEVFNKIADRQWLAQQPQHWFLAPGWNNPFVRPPILPRKVETGETAVFTLDLAPPKDGWQRDGRLRLQLAPEFPTCKWKAFINGTELAANALVAEPFPNPYPSMLGTPAQMRAWTVPAALLVDGKNKIEFTLESGEAMEMDYFDLAMV